LQTINKMKTIYLGGAGGAPTNNVIKSIRDSGNEELIGTSCEITDMLLADVDQKYWVPPANEINYPSYVLSLLNKTKPDFAHFQNDFEIKAISSLRDQIEKIGVKLYMPKHEVIINCVDKSKSYTIWKNAGIKVPETLFINNENDLKKAFNTLGSKIWLRAIEGGGGKGALPTDNYEFAKIWVDNFKGWGQFTAAECLTPNTVTWLSLWYKGELVVAQTRKRCSWNFGNRTLSGVTGITGVGETWSDEETTRISLESIRSIDKEPHGIYGVDLTFDINGIPNPTEINISRFFTTVYFFTKAGLNLPRIFVDIALYNKFPVMEKKINPLPDGLIWIRGMDVEPKLTTTEELANFSDKVMMKL